LGLSLCADLGTLWQRSGYHAEARRRLERAISVAGDEDTEQVGRCLLHLSKAALNQADHERGRDTATRAVTVFRRLGDNRGLSYALTTLGIARSALGVPAEGRAAFEEAATLAEDIDDPQLLAEVLSEMAIFEAFEGNLERSYELDTTVLGIHQQRGDERGVLVQRHDMACTLRQMGRANDAVPLMRELIPGSSTASGPVVTCHGS
jgi:tetratricopeptide (TPR) repeat protein